MYDKITAGETVKFTAHISNLKNKLIDPTGVIFKIQDPDGDIRTFVYGTDASLMRDSLGVFSIDLILYTAGKHLIRWETTSPNVAIEEEEIIAEAKSF